MKLQRLCHILRPLNPLALSAAALLALGGCSVTQPLYRMGEAPAGAPVVSATPNPALKPAAPAAEAAAPLSDKPLNLRLVTDAAPAPLEAVAAPPAAGPAAVPATPAAVVVAPVEDTTPVAPVDTLRPEVRIDIDDRRARTDLWARVRAGTALPPLEGELVRKWEQWYSSRPDYVARMTERGGRYLFHIVEEVERRGMPSDLALLPFIESAFNPQAVSSARASGMWQFMPATGKHFKLRQNLFRDDRRDVLASTRAALDYLEQLYKLTGDWRLALAAYNWGQGNVLKAVARNQREGLPTGYEHLRMPDETRNYVPKLQAIKNIVMRPEAFAVQLPALENHPYFLSVAIRRDIDVDLAARLAGLKLEEFQQLNPQMNKPVILAAGTPQVLLPYDNAARFASNLNRHQGALATWTAWVAPKTVKPAEAARLLGMNEARLREINRIPPRMLVKVGSTLLVPRSQHRAADVSEHVAETAMIALAPEPKPMRRVAFKVGKKGDSVAAVAKRYRLSPAAVAQANQVAASARFKPGQTVVVMLPVKGKATKMAMRSGHRKASAKHRGRVRVAAR